MVKRSEVKSGENEMSEECEVISGERHVQKRRLQLGNHRRSGLHLRNIGKDHGDGDDPSLAEAGVPRG